MYAHGTMTNCTWNDDGPPWKCPQCDQPYARKGVPILSDKPPHRNCPAMRGVANSTDSGQNTMIKKVPRLAKAVVRWIKAGRPTRSDDEVARIFDTLCRPCEFFSEARGSCTKCGCKINRNGSALRNKIRMGSEKCPKKKW